VTIEYHIDDETGVVYTRLIGRVVISDFVEHQRRLAEDVNFNGNSCELIDTTDGSIGEGLGFRSFSQIADTSPWQPHARRAIVVSSNLTYGLANVFSMIMSKEHGEIALFKDIEAACAWLGINTPEKTD